MPEGFFDGAIVSRRFYWRILVDYRRFFVDYQRNGCGYRRIFVDYQRFSVDYRHFNKKGDIQVKWMSLTSQAFGFGLLYSFGLAIGGSLSTISATGVAIGGFLSTISDFVISTSESIFFQNKKSFWQMPEALNLHD